MSPQNFFVNADLAKDWDSRANRSNPTRPEQLDILLSILLDHYQPNQWVLDLGFGSGLVEAELFSRHSDVKVVGVDASQEMMNLAAKRLAPYADRYEAIQHDLSDLANLELPPYSFGAAIAIQSLHHLEYEQMPAVYQWIHDKLQPNGLCLLLDRIKVADESLFSVYQSLWRRLDGLIGSQAYSGEGETFAEHEQKVVDRGDLPATPEQHLAWMRQAGFSAVILHLHGNRAIIVGKKLA